MAQNPIVTFEIEMGNAFGVETGVIKAELYPRDRSQLRQQLHLPDQQGLL